eukprot:9145092-Heterocapsa_arctica.AAC.1
MAVCTAWVMVSMSTGPRASRRIMRWKPLWGHSNLAVAVAASLFTSENWTLMGILNSLRCSWHLVISSKDLATLGSTWWTAMYPWPTAR